MTIEVHDLAVSRAGVPLLDAVSFRLTKGEALLVKGPNGSGKTTLLRALIGLLPHESGHISIDRDDTVIATHLDGIKSSLTARQNLEFWSKIYCRSLDDEFLAALNLGPLLSKYGNELSAGQKRRLGLARVAISDAKNWLLDEPTNSLDQKAIKALETLIQNHRKNGGIVIVSSHQKLALPKAKTLDLSKHKPAHKNQNDPFLEGVF